MGITVDYDDDNLQRLFAEMEPKRRLQAIKGGFRKEANYVRKVAVGHLRGSIRSDRDLERGVRARVFKRKTGFSVTIGTRKAGRNGKGEAGFHTNRRGIKVPVLIWAEMGTEERRTKPKKGTRRRASRRRKSHGTGRMRSYGFMAKTRSEVRSRVTDDIHRLVIESVQKTALRYGCK